MWNIDKTVSWCWEIIILAQIFSFSTALHMLSKGAEVFGYFCVTCWSPMIISWIFSMVYCVVTVTVVGLPHRDGNFYSSFNPICLCKFNNLHWKQSKFLPVLQHEVLAMASRCLQPSAMMLSSSRLSLPCLNIYHAVWWANSILWHPSINIFKHLLL